MHSSVERWARPDLLRALIPGWRTRFAPAPTGYLHLGHVVNAVHVWGIARAFGGRVILRVEDHDLMRCRPEYETALLDDLDWLGFTPDEPAFGSFSSGRTVYRQSDNSAAYERALEQLTHDGTVYACDCSRRQVRQVLGESGADEELRYPGTCRDRTIPAGQTFARRVRIPNDTVTFSDVRLGDHTQHPTMQCGDVLLRDRHNQFTYQFAVTVDDMDQGIDVVIRGEDLLASTGRQFLLARMLGRANTPLMLHHALVRHTDGRKLSKAAGDTAVRELRVAGVSAAALIGEAAFRSGLQTTARPLSAEETGALFGH